MTTEYPVDQERKITPATLSDRLLAIQALTLLFIVKDGNYEQYAGVIARLMNAEHQDAIESSASELDSYDAEEGLRLACDRAEERVDIREYGARQDRDTGVWDDTDSSEAACADARESAAFLFIQHVHKGIVLDIHQLAPQRAAERRAREIAVLDKGLQV